MISFTDVLHDLVRRGLTLRIDQDGTLFIYDPQPPAGAEAAKPENAAADEATAQAGAAAEPAENPLPAELDDPMERRHAAALAARCRRPLLPKSGIVRPVEQGWRGITWLDVPGHDRATKKLNFSLLKRGLLKGHKCCAELEGPALKQKLQDLSARNRHNSRLRQAHARLPAQSPNPQRPTPP